MATLAVVPTGTPEPEEPKIATASDEAANQISAFKIPEDFSTPLFAAEPLLPTRLPLPLIIRAESGYVNHSAKTVVLPTIASMIKPGLKETSQLLLSKTESTITKNCLAKKLAITLI